MFRRKMKFLADVFSMITSCIVIAVAVFTTVINPIERIQSVILWQIPAASLVLTLVSLIYPWDRPMGKLEIVLRTAVHYVLINLIVLGAGVIFDWYDPTNWRNVIAMLVSIAVIFALVDGISWRRSAREAREMNEKLKEYVKIAVDKSDPSMYNESVCEDKPH
ncbi:MAG: DUF3021 domain-containing protein [Butyrivibrio sp.]|nr:DUF3021 domain-containing protein [Acetatifactor muris]MCM1558491.1 DUF3021 domain-containing protein [Butyrivibrio sp.]